jgi:hypothetical protein
MAKSKREPKKPYAKPTLTVYGTVREVTQSVGNMGRMDGGINAGRMMSAI